LPASCLVFFVHDKFVTGNSATGIENWIIQPCGLLSDVFLRLIKMIVAPLVFTTLSAGIAKQGGAGAVGRIGGKTVAWFVCGSFVSLFLGMAMVNLFQPGAAMHLTPPASADNTINKSVMTLRDFIYHVFPSNFFDAMARNEILQVVVFSIFFGIATGATGEKSSIVVNFLDASAHILLKMTGYIMNFAPFAVFGAMTVVITKEGPGILATYSRFIAEFYLGLIILFALLAGAAYLFIGKLILKLIRHLREPSLIAFSTNASEAAFPKLMLELERYGCDEKIVSFVLPLGYSFNLAGSMLYMTFASLFIAQSYGVSLDPGTQFSMLMVLMLTSKGIAGVPRASLVVVAGTLATFKIPEAGLALLLGIDPLMDMGRSCLNVIGNGIAAGVIDKTERN